MIQRHGTTARWSEACVHNGVAYLGGQLADDTSQGFASQIAQTLAAIDRALAMAGSDKSQLLTTTIYMSDLSYMPELNAAWEAWLPMGCAPGRTTVKADMVDPNCMVEITVIAAVGASSSGVHRVAEGL
jgi:enamine deaminase RidA (YjgF/YER057c/UK114 family)